jgi:FKBP-type peptidyl-prolyl cis-trans isomerase
MNLQAKKAAASSSDTNAASSTTADVKKKSNSLEIHDMRVGNGPDATLGKSVCIFLRIFLFFIRYILGCCLLYWST